MQFNSICDGAEDDDTSGAKQMPARGLAMRRDKRGDKTICDEILRRPFRGAGATAMKNERFSRLP